MIAISESITDHSICMFDETVNKSAVISCRSIFQKAGVTAMMYVKDYMHSTRKKYDIKKTTTNVCFIPNARLDSQRARRAMETLLWERKKYGNTS